MKPVIIKKTYYTVTFMRDDGAVRSFRMRGGFMRFLIFFLCVLLPATGVAGIVVGLNYRYKAWVLADEVRSTERQLADARIRLEQLSSVETIASTLGTSPLGTTGLGIPTPALSLNNELLTRNATAAPKPVAQAPSSDILTLLQNGEANDAAAAQNATRADAPADNAAPGSGRNATMSVAAGPATSGNATQPVSAPSATTQGNATSRAPAPYEDGGPSAQAVAPNTSFEQKLPQITDPQSPVRIANFQIQPQAAARRLRLRFELVSQDQQRVSGQIHYQLQMRDGTRQELESVEGARYFSIAWKRQMEGAARLPQGVEVSDIQALGVRITMEDGTSYHAKYLLNGE